MEQKIYNLIRKIWEDEQDANGLGRRNNIPNI